MKLFDESRLAALYRKLQAESVSSCSGGLAAARSGKNRATTKGARPLKMESTQTVS